MIRKVPKHYFFSNCFLYALTRKLQYPNSSIKHDWIFNQDLGIMIPHFYWKVGDMSFHFVSHSKYPGGIKPFWFRGRVKRKD